MASDWDRIPSIPNLTVDWDYEPDNSLGKRLWKRLAKQNLQIVLGVNYTPVKLITAKTEIKGRLVDISSKGLGILLETAIPVGEKGKIGFHLGKKTIVAQAVAKNSVRVAKNHRIGLEFVGLSDQTEDDIVQLMSSGNYGKI